MPAGFTLTGYAAARRRRGRGLAMVLSAACVLAMSGCMRGPPVTFVTRNGSNYIGAPGNFGI